MPEYSEPTWLYQRELLQEFVDFVSLQDMDPTEFPRWDEIQEWLNIGKSQE